MSFIDIAIILVVVFGMWRGFGAGMIATLTSLVAWFLALVVASHAAADFAPLFVTVVDDPVLQVALAFLVVILIVLAVVNIFSSLLKRTTKALKLGFIDRIGGGALGAITGILKVLIVMSLIAPLLAKTPSWQSAVLAPSLVPYAPVAKTLLQKTFGEAWKQIANPFSNQQ